MGFIVYSTIALLIFFGLAIGLPTYFKMKEEDVEWDFVIPASLFGGGLWPVVVMIGIFAGIVTGGRWLFEHVFDAVSDGAVRAVKKFPRIKIEVGKDDKRILD